MAVAPAAVHQKHLGFKRRRRHDHHLERRTIHNPNSQLDDALLLKFIISWYLGLGIDLEHCAKRRRGVGRGSLEGSSRWKIWMVSQCTCVYAYFDWFLRLLISSSCHSLTQRSVPARRQVHANSRNRETRRPLVDFYSIRLLKDAVSLKWKV